MSTEKLKKRRSLDTVWKCRATVVLENEGDNECNDILLRFRFKQTGRNIHTQKRHLHTDSQGKKPMTLFPFTLNYIIAYFLKSIIITPKILKTKNDRFYNQIRKGQLASINYIQIK